MKKIQKHQWGYAGVWHGDFRCWDGDDFMNRLKFLVDHGFHSTALWGAGLEQPGRLQQVADYANAHGLRFSPGFHCKYITDTPDQILRTVDATLQQIDELRKHLKICNVHTNVGPYHRFMREPSLEFQMERLRLALTPLAAGLHEMGIPLGLENHCDFYGSDLAELCRAVPHLGVQLDTGNFANIGERAPEACRAVAPYVVSTHLKDFYLGSNEQALSFECKGASLGAGDVGLREIITDLLRLHPAPETIDFQWEWIPDATCSAFESIERSWAFCREFTA